MKISEIMLVETPDDDRLISTLERHFFAAMSLPGAADKLNGKGMTLGQLINKRSDDILAQYLLSIKIRFNSNCINLGEWHSHLHVIILQGKNELQYPSTTLVHELRHAVDTYKSGNRHYPETHYKLPWDARPGELSAEYMQLVSILQRRIDAHKAFKREITPRLLFSEIKNVLSHDLRSTLKRYPNPRKRLLSRLYVTLKNQLTNVSDPPVADAPSGYFDNVRTFPCRAFIDEWNWEDQFEVESLTELKIINRDAYNVVRNPFHVMAVGLEGDDYLLVAPGTKLPVKANHLEVYIL